MNIEAPSQEHFWGVELSKENPSFTWTFEEEDEDNDYMVHTLFLKNAVLGASAVKGERNLVEIETQNFEKKKLKQPLLSLTLGNSDMCPLDMSFGHEVAVTFRLAEGEGPIALSGQQLVEFPPEEICSQDESALDTEDTAEELTEEEEESPIKNKKRKAAEKASKKAKKGKTESSADDSMEDEEDEEDEDEEDEEDEEEMDDDAESSPEKGKKKPAAKGKKGRNITVTLKKGKNRRIVKAKRRKSSQSKYLSKKSTEEDHEERKEIDTIFKC